MSRSWHDHGWFHLGSRTRVCRLAWGTCCCGTLSRSLLGPSCWHIQNCHTYPDLRAGTSSPRMTLTSVRMHQDKGQTCLKEEVGVSTTAGPRLMAATPQHFPEAQHTSTEGNVGDVRSGLLPSWCCGYTWKSLETVNAGRCHSWLKSEWSRCGWRPPATPRSPPPGSSGRPLATSTSLCLRTCSRAASQGQARRDLRSQGRSPAHDPPLWWAPWWGSWALFSPSCPSRFLSSPS